MRLRMMLHKPKKQPCHLSDGRAVWLCDQAVSTLKEAHVVQLEKTSVPTPAAAVVSPVSGRMP